MLKLFNRNKKNNIEKVAFGELIIEVTRRCNLKCKHCLKGEAQNLDMGYEEIDALLDQTLAIENLFFTGGEPFLALEKMEYFLDAIKQRNIILLYVSIVTNGTHMNSEVVRILNKYDEYIRDWHKRINEIESIEDDDKYIHITVSMDKYHENNPEEYLKWVENEIDNIVYADYQLNGVAVLKCGKAMNLSDATPEQEGRNKIFGAIAVYGKGRKCFCRAKPKWDNEPDYLTIMCSQYYTAKGKLVKMGNIDYDEEDSDRRLICDVISGESIISAIDRWNETHPLLCFQVEDILTRQHKLNSPEYHSGWIRFNHDKNLTLKNDIERKGGREVIESQITDDMINEFVEADKEEKYFNTTGKYEILAEYKYGDCKDVYLKYRFLSPKECRLFQKATKMNDVKTIEKLKTVNYGREILSEVHNKVIDDIDTLHKIKATQILREKFSDMSDSEFIDYITIANNKYDEPDTKETMKFLVELGKEKNDDIYKPNTVSEFVPKYDEYIMFKLSDFAEKNIKTLDFVEEDYYKIQGYKYLIELLRDKELISSEFEEEAFEGLYNQIDTLSNSIKELGKHRLMMGVCKLFGMSAW